MQCWWRWWWCCDCCRFGGGGVVAVWLWVVAGMNVAVVVAVVIVVAMSFLPLLRPMGWGTAVSLFGQPCYFCLGGQASRLRGYATSTIASFRVCNISRYRPCSSGEGKRTLFPRASFWGGILIRRALLTIVNSLRRCTPNPHRRMHASLL